MQELLDKMNAELVDQNTLYMMEWIAEKHGLQRVYYTYDWPAPHWQLWAYNDNGNRIVVRFDASLWKFYTY